MKTTKRKYNKEYYEIIEKLESKFKRKHKFKFSYTLEEENLKNLSFDTFLRKIIANCPETSYVSSGREQCHNNANRSLGDLYVLSNYYYPNTTLLEIMEIIKTKTAIGCYYCYDVKKRVFHIGCAYEGYTDENKLPKDFIRNLRKGEYDAE